MVATGNRIGRLAVKFADALRQANRLGRNHQACKEPAMTVTIYGIPNCDTMKKARTWLEGHGVDYAFHDYRKQGLEAGRLDGWIGQLGWEILLNKSSATFRGLSDAEKKSLDARKARALMLANPTMIKRPVLDTGDGRLLVGFKPDIYERELD
jgi:Spx/MgsR family transcriptional regulator